MSRSTTFTKSEIDRLRDKAAKEAAPPNKSPEGWSFSPVDPQKTLAVFNNLKLKEGFVLRAYQFREGDNGNGIVWAMPEDVIARRP